MKKQLLALFSLLLTGSAFCQTIPNGGFENWTTHQYVEPTYYQTSNSSNNNGVSNPGNAVKTTDAYHGSYAIQLNTVLVGTDTAFAFFANGDPGQTPVKGGLPYAQKPTGFRCYYKSNIIGTDTALIIAMFKKNGAVIGSYFFKIYTTKTSYTLFNPTFSPALTAIPDTVVFGAVSSNPFIGKGGTPGNMLQLDSISFTGVSQQPTNFNGDMELWQPKTANTLNGWASDGGDNSVLQTTDKYTGTFALELQTMGPSFGGSNQVQPGNVITGTPVNGSSPVGGHPYSSQVDTLVFYYKYIPADPNDSASVSINFSKNGVGLGGQRKLLGTAVGVYQKVMIPINLPSAPDTAMINIQSSNAYTWPYPNSFVGSDLKIDNMYLASQKLPITNFSLPLTGCVGVPIQLIDSSLNMATGWTWVIGGGIPSSSSLENPTVIYNTAGSHTISMIATNSFGNGVQVYKHITINTNPSISATSATVCQGSHATVTVNGANTYTWSTSATTASISVNPTTTTVYTVMGTNLNGCKDSTIAVVNILTAPVPDICMVSADDSSKYNIIFWDKTPYANVDSFIAYREVSSNVYKRIGAQHYSMLSQMLDTARSVGGPNGGNPNGGTYRYKLQTRDTCGNYSALSPYHNTVYITNSGGGQFSWATPYQIEGQPSPDTNYVLSCDTANINVWTPVSSVAGTQQTINDPGFTHHQNIANWRVDALGFNCTPTMLLSGSGNNTPMAARIKSHSNQTNNRSVGIKQISGSNSQVSVYPNPSKGSITISNSQKMDELKVSDVLGNIVYEAKPTNQNTTLYLENSGVYFITVISGKETIVKKVVVNN